MTSNKPLPEQIGQYRIQRMLGQEAMGVDEVLEPLSFSKNLSVQNVNSMRPILQRALQPRAELRYQSAKQFIDKLQHIADMDLTEAKIAFFPTAALQRPASASDSAHPPTSPSQMSDQMLAAMEQSLTSFIGPLARVLVRKNSQASSVIKPNTTLSEDHMALITQQLTFFVGPMAGRLVRMAVKKHASTDTLLHYLAEQIPDPQERKQFLTTVEKQL